MSEARADKTAPKVDFFATMDALRTGKKRLDDLPEDVVERFTTMMNTDRQSLQLRFDSTAERERRSPKVGMRAPDFNLELLDTAGKRTSGTRALADHLDKPIALIFGSYT